MSDKQIATDGGSYVQRDASTGGGAFTGRDYQKFEGGVILNFDDPKEPHAVITEQTLQRLVEKVNRLIILIDGDVNYDSPGMRVKMTALEKDQEVLDQRMNLLSNWNRIILVIATLSAVISLWAIFLK